MKILEFILIVSGIIYLLYTLGAYLLKKGASKPYKPPFSRYSTNHPARINDPSSMASLDDFHRRIPPPG